MFYFSFYSSFHKECDIFQFRENTFFLLVLESLPYFGFVLTGECHSKTQILHFKCKLNPPCAKENIARFCLLLLSGHKWNHYRVEFCWHHQRCNPRLHGVRSFSNRPVLFGSSRKERGIRYYRFVRFTSNFRMLTAIQNL